MELESFAKLEERINKAVAFIEELTKRNKQLEDENKEMTTKIDKLEEELKSMEASLSKRDKTSSQVSEKVKEKIEGLLSKIDNFEKSIP
jgi:predicted RNase H-like nuclease (RuvC/YqgF family)